MQPLDDTQQRLLEAGGQVFAEKGFEGATVREICKRAGVNIAAVNYYFRDKERLYIEAVKHAACGSQEGHKVPEWAPGTPPAVKLRDFIRMFAARLMDRTRPAWQTQLMMRELAQPTSACAEWVRDYVRPMSEALGDVLREILPPRTPQWKLYMTAFSIIGQCVFYVQCKPVVRLLVGDKDHDRFTAETVGDHIAAFCLTALGLTPPVGASGATVRS
jgi:AcrR family transcriptional regulator